MIHEIRDVIELNCVFFLWELKKYYEVWWHVGNTVHTKEINQKKDPHPLLYAIWQNTSWCWTSLNYAYLRILSELCGKATFHIYILIPMHKINLIQTYFSVKLNRRNAATTVPHGFNLNLHKRKCFNQTKQRVHSLNKAEKSHNF